MREETLALSSKFKAKCLALMDEVARTGETILVRKNGKPVAELWPHRGPRAKSLIVLDTHVLAWADNDERRLGRKAKALINRMWNRGEVAVCAMSFWEVAMLQARGRIELPATADEWRGQLLAAGLVELPVDGTVGITGCRYTK